MERVVDLRKFEERLEERLEERFQTSETFLLSSVLAFSGGFQDAYTYNVRDRVFSNAQTGNVVLMSQHIMMGDFAAGIRYLFPVLAFAAGVLLAEQVEHRYKNSRKVHWRQIIVILEIVMLLAVGFIPATYNMAATVIVSLACSMQVQTFRKVKGYSYASTMCIGNLRSGTESLSVYIRERQPGALRKALHYYGIIAIFAIGAGIGGVCSKNVGIHSIWVSCVLLAAAGVMMIREHK